VIDPGWLGSPVDVATFLVVLYGMRHEIQPRLDVLAAGVVALAEEETRVDGDRLAAELNVEDGEVDALRPVILCDEEAAEESTGS